MEQDFERRTKAKAHTRRPPLYMLDPPSVPVSHSSCRWAKMVFALSLLNAYRARESAFVKKTHTQRQICRILLDKLKVPKNGESSATHPLTSPLPPYSIPYFRELERGGFFL